jgi:hypothetical protein
VGHGTSSCIFTGQVWQLMLTPLGLLSLMLEYEDELEEWCLRQRACLDSATRPTFDSSVLLTVDRLEGKEQ